MGRMADDKVARSQQLVPAIHGEPLRVELETFYQITYAAWNAFRVLGFDSDDLFFTSKAARAVGNMLVPYYAVVLTAQDREFCCTTVPLGSVCETVDVGGTTQRIFCSTLAVEAGWPGFVEREVYAPDKPDEKLRALVVNHHRAVIQQLVDALIAKGFTLPIFDAAKAEVPT